MTVARRYIFIITFTFQLSLIHKFFRFDFLLFVRSGREPFLVSEIMCHTHNISFIHILSGVRQQLL